MCNDRNSFISFKKLSANARITVKLGDQSSVTVLHYGRVRLQGAELTALYTPTFRISLLSVGQLDIAGYISTFGKGVCEIPSDNHTISGRKRENLYMVEAECSASALVSKLRLDASGKGTRKKKRKRSESIVANQPGPQSQLQNRSYGTGDWHISIRQQCNH